MKTIVNLVLAATVFIAASCTDSLPRRFASFLSKVETECPDYAYSDYSDYLELEEYWMNVDEEFHKLYEEYAAKRSSFSSDVKRDINAGIARYECLRINSFVSFVEECSEDFSEDDWLNVNEKITELAREYKGNRHSYNSGEKRRINSEFLHYFGIVLRSKTSDLIGKVRDLLRELGLL